MGLDERDFYEALAAIGPCKHVKQEHSTTLDTVCRPCRISVSKLVLLRDNYRQNPQFYQGYEPA